MMKVHISMPIMISMTRYYHNLKQKSRLLVISTKIHKSFLIFSLVAIAAIVYSCEEDPTDIGKDFFPAGDFSVIKSTDTLSVFGYTAYNSSIRSDNRNLTFLGKLSDPYFGETKSDFVSQLQLAEEWKGGGRAFTVDSVKFFLVALDFKGSTTAPQSISICETTDFLTTNTAYYSDIAINRGVDFGTFPLPVNSLIEDTATTLVVPLPVSVGEYLLRDTTKLFRSSTEPDFRTFFKGLYVSMVDSPNPLFLTTTLTQSEGEPGAGIIVYFHNSVDTLLSYSFWMNQNAVSVNRYEHSAKNGLPGKNVVNVRVKDTVTYLQNYNGVFTRLEIPGLAELKSLMPISVNKARLKMPVFFDSLLYKPSTLPSQILARYKNATGGIDTVPDYKLFPTYQPLYGIYSKSANEYIIDIASFTQLYLEGVIPEPVIELFLPVGSSNNVILNMNENNRAAKMEFTYTKF